MTNPATSLLEKIQQIKATLPPDTLLFTCVGGFYELYYEDAQRAAPILRVKLETRGTVPVCGVPCYMLDDYLAKAIRAGKKVAIYDGGITND